MYRNDLKRHAVGGAGTLLIGYGNPLCGDDGAGPAVVQRLERLLGRQAGGAITWRIERQPLPELAEPISRARRVIFIDASVCLAPGQVQVHRLRAQDPEYCLGHHLSPEQLLALCREGFGACPAEVWMVAIGAQSLALGDELSGVVARTIERLCRHLQYRLQLWMRHEAQRLSEMESFPRLRFTGTPLGMDGANGKY